MLKKMFFLLTTIFMVNHVHGMWVNMSDANHATAKTAQFLRVLEDHKNSAAQVEQAYRELDEPAMKQLALVGCRLCYGSKSEERLPLRTYSTATILGKLCARGAYYQLCEGFINRGTSPSTIFEEDSAGFPAWWNSFEADPRLNYPVRLWERMTLHRKIIEAVRVPQSGLTLLHHAVFAENTAMVAELLELGANRNFKPPVFMVNQLQASQSRPLLTDPLKYWYTPAELQMCIEYSNKKRAADSLKELEKMVEFEG